MKKLFWILMFFSGIASAQELDSAAVDTLNVPLDTLDMTPPYYLGVYLEGGVSFDPGVTDRNLLSTVGVGIQYERWQLSVSRYDFHSEVTSLLIFPNAFKLNYRFGGVTAGYQFYRQEWVNATLSVGYYKGDMTWRNREDGADFLRDEFDLLKFGLQVGMEKFRYAKPHITIGYQQMSEIDLTLVEGGDFSGLFFAVGLRIGYFNQ